MPNIKDKEPKSAKSIFVANVKGGVGKSTLSIMLARVLAEKIPPQNITVIDTDLQRTATEFLSKSKIFGGEILMRKIGNAGKVYLVPKLKPASLES